MDMAAMDKRRSRRSPPASISRTAPMGPLGSDAAVALAVPATDTSQQRQKFRQADEDGKIVCCPRIPCPRIPNRRIP